MIQLIASDMDGTLLSSDQLISPRTYHAIHAARKAGISFLPITGRGYQAAQHMLRMLNLPTNMINLNGAVYTDRYGVAHRPLYLPSHVLEEMLCFVHEHHLDYGLITTSAYYTTRHALYRDHIHRFIREQADLMKKADLPTVQLSPEETTTYLKASHEVSDTLCEKVLKLIFFTEDLELQETFMTHFGKHHALAVTSSGSNNIEITHHDATKGNALKTYCDKKGIDMSRVVTIGDSYNDLSMFKVSGYSFAMQNANDDIKQHTTHQALSNDQEGVADMIERVLSGEIG